MYLNQESVSKFGLNWRNYGCISYFFSCKDKYSFTLGPLLSVFGTYLKPYSLSMWSNYSVFIFLCPKIVSKQYPWKKTESPNYPNSIWEILAMSQIFSMFFKNLCFLLNENSRCLDFFTDTVWILENLHKFQLIIWDIAKISRIVF